MILKKTFLLLLTLSAFCAYAQNTLNGVLTSIDTNSPIPSAHVYVKNTSLGTITNEDGYFILTIPNEYKKHILVISSLGFKTIEQEILNLLGQDNIILTLAPTEEKLEEVIITNRKELSAFQIVQKAFNNYSEKYSSYPYIAKGYIRHTEKTEKEYKWLVEAAIEIYDPGPKNDVKVNIIETRKSFDNRDLDTTNVVRKYLHDANNKSFRKNHKRAGDYKNSLTALELEKAFNYYDNHFTLGYNKKLGFLEKIFSTDKNLLRDYDQKKALFVYKNLDEFEFKKDTILFLGDDKVHKIKFSIYNKTKTELNAGWIYIKDSDFKIVEINHTLLLGKGHYYRRATGNRVRFSSEIKYKEYNNKMYPFFISLKTNKSIGYNSSESIIETLTTHQEVLFSEIIDDKLIINKLSSKIKSGRNNLFKKDKYNSTFWEGYNIILEAKDQQKLISDLEKKVSLKQQFKKE